MDKTGIQEAAEKISQTLQKSPSKLEFFKSHPEESIKEISGIKGMTKKDVTSILDVLLKNSGDGGGLLGNVLGTLIDGKKTKSGEKNVVGELIKQVAGSKDSQVLIGSLLSQILGQGAAETTSSSKKTSTAKKSTGSNATTKKSTTASTTSKSTGTGSTAKKPTSSSSAASKSTTASAAKTTTAASTAKKPAGSSSSSTAKKPASSNSTAKKSTTTSTAKKAPTKTGTAKKGGSDDVLGTIGTIIDKSGIDVGDLVGNLLSNKSTKGTKKK